VGEEFDENHESSGDSDEEMAEADSDNAPEKEELAERPKKKLKTAK
jgi:structure-specific recognition protein 1